jgi:AcrR family transcriptional regulator
MPRPVSIQDDVILRAARETFLEKGWDATTSEIAGKAGVSHGIIFKRFKTKQALFQSAMQDQSNWGQAVPTLLKSSVGRKDVETTLVELGSLFVEKFLVLIPTLMMAWSNKQDIENQIDSVGAANKQRATRALQAVKNIAAYLEAENRLGRIRDTDFEVVAQAFVGALWHHSFLQVMLTGGKSGPAKERRYVKRLVKAMWSGIAP